MKFFLIFIFYLSGLSLYSQRLINKEEVVGRWVTESSIDSAQTNMPSYIYHFKEDMSFHLGEIYEGVILFNIAGRYTIKENVISVNYFDFSQKGANARKLYHISFDILSLNAEKMTLLCKDNDYEYQIYLNRQKKHKE